MFLRIHGSLWQFLVDRGAPHDMEPVLRFCNEVMSPVGSLGGAGEVWILDVDFSHAWLGWKDTWPRRMEDYSKELMNL